MTNNKSRNSTEENRGNERKPARKRGSFFRGIFAVITALGNLVFLAIIIDKTSLYELTLPEALYLWTGY
jgi:hypothetical protein